MPDPMNDDPQSPDPKMWSAIRDAAQKKYDGRLKFHAIMAALGRLLCGEVFA